MRGILIFILMAVGPFVFAQKTEIYVLGSERSQNAPQCVPSQGLCSSPSDVCCDQLNEVCMKVAANEVYRCMPGGLGN